jgi:predicted O-methyltransferase YrrM
MEKNANGMLNWVDDIPFGSKNIFENVLELFRDKENVIILEIGVFVGRSIIETLKKLPNSFGFAIDNWGLSKEECMYTNDIKTEFLKNIKEEKVEERIKLLEGDSFRILLNIHRSGLLFDFIYVDGSHISVDCYADIIISWDMLKKGGVLAVDDYEWNLQADKYDRCKESIDHFLKKIEGEYIMLNKGYRVFLLKK